MSDNATKTAGPIRDLRRAAGLSQEALARLADCSTAYVRVLERGYVPASPDEAPVYARVLDALHVNEPPARATAPEAPKAVTAARDGQ